MKLIDNLYFYPEQGMLNCNTYVITGNPGIIIDPGASMYVRSLIDSISKDGIDPTHIGTITNTHLHGDHCGANEVFKKISGAKIIIHSIQKKFYDNVIKDSARFFNLPPMEFKEDSCLDGDRLAAGDTELELIHSPGHAPDCICFYDRGEKALICGDVVFAANTGRTDLPDGNGNELRKSIDRLSLLDINHLLPGHMDIVSGAENVKHNFDLIRENILRWL